MLQQSVVVGIVFAMGAFLNSPSLAVFGLLGSAMGAMTAALAGFDQHDNRNGLFGFNGALVGFGLGYFYGPQWLLLIFVILGGVISALIMQLMQKKGIRPYTFPFVITNWSIMALFTATGWFEIVLWPSTQADGLQITHGISRGFGQVLFQENLITGFLLIAAVLFRSWVEGIFAIAASVLGVFIALMVGFSIDAINLGLFGYNGVLCAIALAGRTRTDIFSALIAVVLSVFFVWSAVLVGVPALTAPFVFSTWIVLWSRAVFDRKLSQN